MPRSILSVVSRVPGADTVKRAGAKLRASAARSAKKAAIGGLALAGFAGLAWMLSPSSPTMIAADETAVVLVETARGAIQDETGRPPDDHASLHAGLVQVVATLERVPLPPVLPGVIISSEVVTNDAQGLLRWFCRNGGTVIVPMPVLMFSVLALMRVLAHIHGARNAAQLYLAAISIVGVVMQAIAALRGREQSRVWVWLLVLSFIFVKWSSVLGAAAAADPDTVTLTFASASHPEALVGSTARHLGDIHGIASAIVTMGNGAVTSHVREAGGLTLSVAGYLSTVVDVGPMVNQARDFFGAFRAAAVRPFMEGGMSPGLADRAAMAISWIQGEIKGTVEAILADKRVCPITRTRLYICMQDGTGAALAAASNELRAGRGSGATGGAAWVHPGDPHVIDTRRVLALIHEGRLHEAPLDVLLGELAAILTASDNTMVIPTEWAGLISKANASTPEQGTMEAARLLLERFVALSSILEVTAKHVSGATHVDGSITLRARNASASGAQAARGAITISLIGVLGAIGSGAVPVRLGYAFSLGISERGAYDYDLVAKEVGQMRDGAEKNAVALMTRLKSLVGDLELAYSTLDASAEAHRDRESKQELASAIAEGGALLDFFAGLEDKLSWVSLAHKPRVALVFSSLASAVDDMQSGVESTRTEGAWRVASLVRQFAYARSSRSEFWMSLGPTVTERPEFTQYLLDVMENAPREARAGYQQAVARRIEKLTNGSFTDMAEIAGRTPADSHRVLSILKPHVEAAERVLQKDHTRNVQREQGQSAKQLWTTLRAARSALEDATVTGTSSTQDQADPDLKKCLTEAVGRAADTYNDEGFAATKVKARAEGQKEPEVAAMLLAWIARAPGVSKDACPWNTELASLKRSVVFETAHIVNSLKEIIKLEPFTGEGNARFTKQVITILDAIKPAQADVTGAEACGSARTSAENLLRSSPWLIGGGVLTQAQNATKLIYDGLQKEAAASAERHGRHRATFDKTRQELRDRRVTTNKMALELINRIRDFRRDGDAGYPLARSWDAHLGMWRTSGAVNTPEFAEVAMQILGSPHFTGENGPYTADVVGILSVPDAPAPVLTAASYRQIVGEWIPQSTVTGAEDVARFSAELLTKLQSAIARKTVQEAAETIVANDKAFEKVIAKYTSDTMPVRVSRLLAWIAKAGGVQVGVSPWNAQRDIWEKSGLLTTISDTLIGNIFRKVAELPRFQEGENPRYVSRVIAMIPQPDDHAAACTTNDISAMQAVVDVLAKAECVPPTGGDSESHAAQACAATRLIVDMLKFAIDKQAPRATGQPGSFGATRTRKGMPVPRRFL